MTQAILNTLNTLEQATFAKKDLQKLSESVNSGMDKSSDFKKIFETKLDKETNINDKTIGKIDSKTDQEVDLRKEFSKNSEIKDQVNLRDENSKESNLASIVDIKKIIETEENSIDFEEFKEFLSKATDEANVETSLDLTLAKDFDEIISQLQEAVEKATEIIESEEENVASSDENIIKELASAVDNLVNNSMKELEIPTEENLQTTDSSVQEQITALLNKDSGLKNSILLDSGDLKLNNAKIQEADSEFKSIEPIQKEIIEFAENTLEEVVSVKQSEELADSNLQELSIDDEILQELKIEKFSSDFNNSNADSFMQNQTPEEHAMKAMINTEVETYEFKVDSAQNVQNTVQVQTKTEGANPSRIIEQISKQLNNLQNNGKVNIVLNPESLGKVNIQLVNSKDGLTAQFTVTTQEAKELLTKGLDGLKESLGTHGVAVDNVSVKLADSQKSEYSQDWTEQEGSRGGNKGQGQPNREEKEKGLFEKMMAQTTNEEDGNV